MSRSFLYIFVLLLVLITICILIVKPKMHTQLVMYSSSFQIVPEEDAGEEIQEVVITKKNPAVQQRQIALKSQSNPTEKKTIVQSKAKEVKQPVVIKKQDTPTSVVNIPIAEPDKILWNKWRSDLQNQIMQDVKLPILPQGVVFKFSFEVDKFGRVSNIKTYSTDPTYTVYAIQNIAPVIKSYQGHAILNFPAGTSRFSTLVEGGWKISNALKYSSPEDFKDVEKVR